MSWPRASRFLTLLLVAACGGKVAVDQPVAATGGAGGASSSSSSSSSGVTTTSGSSSSSASSSGAGDLCAQACAALGAKGCAGPGCVAACQGFTSQPQCADVEQGLLACIRDQAPSSNNCFVDACQPFRDKLLACTTNGTCTASVIGTSGTEQACVGKGICGAGGVELAADCTDPGMCICHLPNGVVATCPEQGPFLCDFANGCCAALAIGGG